MSRFLAIAEFEFATRFKRISTWVYFLVFLTLATLWTAAAGGAFPNANVVFGSGKVHINSPYAISQTIAFLGMIGLTVVAAIMGRAVEQDFENRTEPFFFTAPIRKWQYLLGRFAGALVILLFIFSSVALGIFIGTFFPGLDPERLGHSGLAAYVVPYATVLIPNLVLIGGVFFCLAALTRRMMPVYIGSVLCLIGYLGARALLSDLDSRLAASLLDPFGLIASSRVTEYWTVDERNTQLIPFTGYLRWNRLLWLAVGTAVVAFCYQRFRFQHAAEGRHARAEVPDEAPGAIDLKATTVQPERVNGLKLLPRMTWLYFRETVKSVYFIVFALAGVAFVIVQSVNLGSLYGTNTWPVTYQMLEISQGIFTVFMLVIVTFYAGELVWRERDNRLDQIHDALPIPTWLPFCAKLAALMLVPVVLQAVLLLTDVVIQTFKGYFHYELGLYLHDMFGIQLIDFWLVCVLAITVQSIVNQKYLGHFIMIVYYVAILLSGVMGFEHNLYKYGATPQAMYSDMNGYGHFLPRVRAFQAYYAAWALLLAIAGYLFWTRGTVSGWRERLRVARLRVTPPVVGVVGLGALAMVALGGFIFYNTNILNRYVTTYSQEQRQADYEKKYKKFAALPQPKITSVRLNVDIYPREQRIRMRGVMGLENKSDQPIDTIHLGFLNAEREEMHRIDFGTPSTLVTDDLPIGVRSYKLANPLAPGAKTDFTFDLELPTHGFTNSGSETNVVYNGSFVNGLVVLPEIGYSERVELTTDRDRKKYGLPPKERMRDRDDPEGLKYNYLTHAADWIAFEAEVTTDEDQWAIAPGYLTKDWIENGRRHFVYKMDSPILDFYAFQSARYAVKKDRWNDVAIEIYYQPGHEYNLDRMIAAVKASLDYYTRNFGPYQHRQFRIIEFPRYAQFAQAFPNTIPYSESIGFIARVRENDKDDIDYPYYVTAHEAAHQWWAHQVIGGDVQGSTMLSETLAQYSALMVMKQKYGEAKMQKFLAYELDRYLIGRATEQKKELPLARVENQPYIHYRKGSLVMYALADYIGEDNLNRAIRGFRDETAYSGPPYPNATLFLKHIRAATPEKYQYLIDDMFESITLYDNRAVSAKARALPDGKYEVDLKIAAKKLKAGELGQETEVPLADYIDIGVLDTDGKPLYLEKKKIDRAEEEFTVVVAGKPARAGIDPLNKLIDRRPKDNTVAVEMSGGLVP
jgi:ABC-type transport system involved in multi-copper enzyme maturation permease subunit